MERRSVLRLLSGALVSGAVGRAAAAVQTAPPSPTKWVPADPPSASAPGVTSQQIRIGMSAAFRGTAAGLGTEFYRGGYAEQQVVLVARKIGGFSQADAHGRSGTDGVIRALPTRSGLRHALESLRGFDLGIGAALSFGPERHQGLDSVYFTRVEGERWVPITDWTSAVRA